MVLGMGPVVSSALLNVLFQQITRPYCDFAIFHCSLFSAKAMQLMDQVDTGVNISLFSSLFLCMTLSACCNCVISTVNTALL
jgi:hypothetical protein